MVYAYCTGPIYTMETAACNDITKFQLVGFTICKLPWVQPVIQVFSYTPELCCIKGLMSVTGVRPSIHHAASKVSQVAIDLQLR